MSKEYFKRLKKGYDKMHNHMEKKRNQKEMTNILTLRDLFLMDNNEFVAKIDDKFIRVEDLKKILDEITKDWDSSAIKELRIRIK